MINEETTELDRFLSKEYQLKKYQDLKKLKGIEFNERMKLEFALRDSKNIDAIEYLIVIYKKKKKNDELINSSFYELLKEATNINFFSLNISNIEFYRHELISEELFEIFQYLIETNIEINKGNRSTSVYRKIDDNLIEETCNTHEHYFYANKIIDEFEIKNSYFYNSTDDYIENRYMENDLENKIKKDSDRYYMKTEIKLKNNIFNNSTFNNNVNLELNLAIAEEELTNTIKLLSKLYKNGELSRKMDQKVKNEVVFNTVGHKYLCEPKEFLKLLFIYDMHHSEETRNINNHSEKLFNALSKKIELSAKTVEDLSGKFKKTLENQLYLQL